MNLGRSFDSPAGSPGLAPRIQACSESTIGAWAAAMGLREEETCLLAAAVMRGSAGSRFPDGSLLGDVMLPKADLIFVTPGGFAPPALDALLGPIRQIDRQLRERFGLFRVDTLQSAIHGAVGKGEDESKVPFRATTDALNNHQHVLEPHPTDRNPRDPYDKDMIPEAATSRYRTVMRPTLLLENPLPGKLEELVAECHESEAFAPGIRLERLSARPAGEIDTLEHLMDGGLVNLPDRLGRLSVVTGESGLLHAIFLADAVSFPAAALSLPGVLKRCIVLGGEVPGIPDTLDEEMIHVFANRFRRAVQSLLNARRRGHLPDHFAPPDWELAFRRHELEFRYECLAAPHPCPAAARLPALLAWACSHLVRIDGSGMIDLVMGYSRRLLERQREWLGMLERGSRLLQWEALARQLCDKISRKQPIKRRDLIRSFDIQRTERYLPVLSVLIDAGVLAEHPDKVYCIGSRHFDQAWPELLRSTAPIPL